MPYSAKGLGTAPPVRLLQFDLALAEDGLLLSRFLSLHFPLAKVDVQIESHQMGAERLIPSCPIRRKKAITSLKRTPLVARRVFLIAESPQPNPSNPESDVTRLMRDWGPTDGIPFLSIRLISFWTRSPVSQRSSACSPGSVPTRSAVVAGRPTQLTRRDRNCPSSEWLPTLVGR